MGKVTLVSRKINMTQQSEDDAWVELWDETQKRPYYFNDVTQESVWEAPEKFTPYGDLDTQNEPRADGVGEAEPKQDDRRSRGDYREGNNDRSANYDTNSSSSSSSSSSFPSSSSSSNTGNREDNNGMRLYVGNLPWSATDDSLFDYFSRCGDVVSTKVVYQADGRSRGFGFVTFGNSVDADMAKNKLDGASMDGRPIKVDICLEKGDPRRPPR